MINVYDFSSLKLEVEKVIKKKIDVTKSSFKAPEIHIELDHVQVNEKVKFDKDSIHYITDEGVTVQGYLIKLSNYSRPYFDYVLHRPSILPKFHVCNCSTLDEMRLKGRFHGRYIFANTQSLMSECDEGGGGLDDPRVCSNCIGSIDLPRDLRTKGFVEEYQKEATQIGIFTPTELPIHRNIDEYGYMKDWSERTKAYRASKNYICESCGIKLAGATFFLETHHINSNRSDDREANLKCLCVLCHSKVDEYHIENYQQGKLKSKLEEFKRLFKSNG